MDQFQQKLFHAVQFSFRWCLRLTLFWIFLGVLLAVFQNSPYNWVAYPNMAVACFLPLIVLISALVTLIDFIVVSVRKVLRKPVGNYKALAMLTLKFLVLLGVNFFLLTEIVGFIQSFHK